MCANICAIPACGLARSDAPLSPGSPDKSNDVSALLASRALARLGAPSAPISFPGRKRKGRRAHSERGLEEELENHGTEALCVRIFVGSGLWLGPKQLERPSLSPGSPCKLSDVSALLASRTLARLCAPSAPIPLSDEKMKGRRAHSERGLEEEKHGKEAYC